ncbi:hypothetical protein ACS0TY_035626 [Phlomoides rotata]
MQGATIAFSPSLSLSADSRNFAAARFNSTSLHSRFSNDSSLSFSSTSSSGGKLSPIGCSLKQRGWISCPDPGNSEVESGGGVVRAIAESAGEAESSISKGFSDTLVLGMLFGFWNIFNIYFNIYNKQVLKVFPYPVTVSLGQFALGTVIVILMWTLNIYKRPKISGAQLVAILPLAVVHTLGNLFTNMSLGKVSVSFTHTIKAMEPFFSVLLSAMFLGEYPTLWVVSSLLPVVGGVALASMTEASFNWSGFWSAMASNLTNQSRNVLSKKFMVKKEESLDNITLFSIMTIMSFILMIPTTLVMEGVKFTPSYLQAAVCEINEESTFYLIESSYFYIRILEWNSSLLWPGVECQPDFH